MGMTNAEAREHLKDILADVPNDKCIDWVMALKQAIKALEQQPSDDCISRKATIDALWKALYEYENKTEKQFIDSEELDVADWFQHRVFVQNMSDIDRQTILNMPSVTSQQTRWILVSERLPKESGRYIVTRGLNACGAMWNRVYIINYSDLMGLKSERIWWDGNVGKSDFKRIDDVIAWMPLPEPYRESEVQE